jgi:hypothetical protein
MYVAEIYVCEKGCELEGKRMEKKRKNRTLLQLPKKHQKLVLVDADDWDAVLNISNAVRTTGDSGGVPTDQNRVEDVLWRVDIDQADDEKRIVGFNVSCKGLVCGLPERSVATLDGLKKLIVKWTHFDTVHRPPLPCWPTGIECLANLEELRISINCHVSSHNIFECAGGRITPFPKLRVLDLGDCHHLSEILEEIGSLGPTLQCLKLSLHLIPRLTDGASSNAAKSSSEVFPRSMCKLVHLKRFDVRCTTDVPVPTMYGVDTSFVFPSWREMEVIHLDVVALDLLFPRIAACSPSLSSDSFETGVEDISKSSPHVYWPLLKEATITLPSRIVHAGDDRDHQQNHVELFSSAMKQLSTWTQLQSLRFILHRVNSPTVLTSTCYLPLSLLRPLGQNRLVELAIFTPLLSEPMSSRPDFCGIALEDISGLPNLDAFRARGCRLMSPPTDNGTFMSRGQTCTSVVPPKLTCLELEECNGFFTSSALNVVSSLDLSKLQFLCLSKLQTELGDAEYTTLCRNVLTKCPKLEKLDLSNGNIRHLDGALAQEAAGDLIISSLAAARDSLRVLDLNNNPALRLPESNLEEKEFNIQAMFHWVARFSYLGYLGKFNELFLGRLGENYNRLGDYYCLVHHLALNRAQSRILMGQLVPRGLWANVLEKAQRAFDDYPGHVVARNRKEAGDAIFHLLRERGAKDIFFNF